jgi:hypothetical protein
MFDLQYIFIRQLHNGDLEHGMVDIADDTHVIKV